MAPYNILMELLTFYAVVHQILKNPEVYWIIVIQSYWIVLVVYSQVASVENEQNSRPTSQLNDTLTTSSSVPSFHEAAPVKMTASQELLVQLAEANVEEKEFTTAQQIKK